MSNRTSGGPWGRGMRAAVCSLQKYILTVSKDENGNKTVRRRMRNQNNPKEWIGLAGFLGKPKTDKSWRAFVKQRKLILSDAVVTTELTPPSNATVITDEKV